MADPGDVIDNPVTGEQVVFRKTGDETDGRLLQFEMYVEPSGFVAAEHVHPHQTEHFLVEHGELCLRSHGAEQVYEEGEEATIPQDTPHVWWNSGSSELHLLVEMRPASRFDEFLTTLFALAQDGQTDEKGMPGLLQMAVLMEEYADVIRPTRPPQPVQEGLFALLAPIGRWFGYRADHPYPSPAEAQASKGV